MARLRRDPDVKRVVAVMRARSADLRAAYDKADEIAQEAFETWDKYPKPWEVLGTVRTVPEMLATGDPEVVRTYMSIISDNQPTLFE